MARLARKVLCVPLFMPSAPSASAATKLRASVLRVDVRRACLNGLLFQDFFPDFSQSVFAEEGLVSDEESWGTESAQRERVLRVRTQALFHVGVLRSLQDADYKAPKDYQAFAVESMMWQKEILVVLGLSQR